MPPAASGASFAAGSVMLIADHINLTFRNPLTGPVLPGEERFPDMSDPYDPELRTLAREVALREKVALAEGVYVQLLGPSYETPAEIRMLERLGADAVGMSTAVEVIAARARGHALPRLLGGHQPRGRHLPGQAESSRGHGDGAPRRRRARRRS